MKQVYFLYNFNPYHNRQIKRYDTVAEYTAAAGDYYVSTNPKNFAYNDGVDTTIQERTNSAINNPDYALVVTPATGVIESRWFVLDAVKQLDKSYKLTLHRDLIADSFDDVINAPMFVEKARLNTSDPYIFNSEGISVNQIKKGETLLKDESGCAWMVGYVAPDITAGNVDGVSNKHIDYTYTSKSAFYNYLSAIGIFNYCRGSSIYLPGLTGTSYDKRDKEYCIKLGWNLPSGTNPVNGTTIHWEPNKTVYADNNVYSSVDALNTAEGYKASFTGVSWLSRNSMLNTLKSKTQSSRDTLQGYINTFRTPTELIEQYEGKIWKIDGEYYRSVVKTGSTVLDFDNLNNEATGVSSTVIDFIKNLKILTTSIWSDIQTNTNTTVKIGYNYESIYLDFEQLTEGAYRTQITGNEPLLNNLPYKMVVIPIDLDGTPIEFYDSNNTLLLSMEKETAVAIINGLSTKYSGSNSIYDIQLLPYCPIRELIKGDHKLYLPQDSNAYHSITDGTYVTEIGYILWATDNEFSFDIEHAINVSNIKLESMVDMYRLCSPNWNGQFEFNAAKNGGVRSFNVDCTYKPYNPYIHINPDFGLLYGSDFNDARGLICAGDFSLPQLNDTWQTYEINNKNYSNQFSRQIQNLELTQDIQMMKQKVAAATGVISGAVSGAAAGSIAGAGIAGAVAGGALSAVGAAIDIKTQQILNEEAVDFAKDNFVMQNQNISAMPDSLKNVGAFTGNNKIYPVLEYYSCTNEEKTAVENELYYKGMTVNRVGTIAEFLTPEEMFIKGKLIRINISEDSHYIEVLAAELSKGVYMKI